MSVDRMRGERWEVPPPLIEYWRQEHPKTVALALSGSRAVGDYRPHSDVDLVAVSDEGGFERVYECWNAYRIEAVCGPWSWFEHVITDYERRQNIGTITGMVARALVLFGGGLRWERLSELARDYWARGPEPASAAALEKSRERLWALYDNYRDAGDEGVRAWVGWSLLTELADYAFKAGPWWQEKPPRVLSAWALHDPVTAEAVRRAILDGLTEASLKRLLRIVADLP